MEDVMSVAPAELLIDNVVSSSEFVKNRRMVEILPDSQSQYGSGAGGAYRATFNIGSASNEFLDSMNSYFKCDLKVESTPEEKKSVTGHLDIGGIHAMIKSITVQTRNGVRIEHIDNYNKLYAMLRCATVPASHVESVQSYECGDSLAHRAQLDPTALYKASSANQHTFTALTAADVQLFKPVREKLADGNTHKITFKISSDFLSHYKYLPLPMLQQLQIIFEFERPQLAYFITKKGDADAALEAITATDAMSYTISNFRYVANMVEVADSVMESFEQIWRGPGINLPFQSYRAFTTSLSGDGSSVELQFGCNSARFVLMSLMRVQSFTESNSAKAYPSQSMFLKNNLKSYRLQSGGKVFPAHAPINCESDYAGEAFSQLMIALNAHQNTLKDTSIRSWELDASHVSDFSSISPITDATKFIIGVDLTDVNSFSGLNTTGNNLVVDLAFSSSSDRRLVAFICFDSVVTLSKSLGAIVRS